MLEMTLEDRGTAIIRIWSEAGGLSEAMKIQEVPFSAPTDKSLLSEEVSPCSIAEKCLCWRFVLNSLYSHGRHTAANPQRHKQNKITNPGFPNSLPYLSSQCAVFIVPKFENVERLQFTYPWASCFFSEEGILAITGIS